MLKPAFKFYFKTIIPSQNMVFMLRAPPLMWMAESNKAQPSLAYLARYIREKHFSTLPMVNFHMLSIEEKYSCWNQRDVKVTCVDWHSVDIHNVYVSHTRNIMRRLGQLFCQGKITQYEIIHGTLNL